MFSKLTGFWFSCIMKISRWKFQVSRCVSSVHVTWSEPASALSIDFGLHLCSPCNRMFLYCLQLGWCACYCSINLLYNFRTSDLSFTSFLSSGSKQHISLSHWSKRCQLSRKDGVTSRKAAAADPDRWENGFKVSDVRREHSTANPRKLKLVELVREHSLKDAHELIDLLRENCGK